MLNQAWNNGRVRAMKKLIHEVPSGLDDLYLELLSKGRDAAEIKESVLMFQWVLFAQRILSPKELYFAVLAGTDPDHLAAWDQQKESSETICRFITSASKGLIEALTVVDDDYPAEGDNSEAADDPVIVVQFIHESVRDFLLDTKGLRSLDPSLSQHSIGNSHSRLVNCCLSYIMMESLELLEKEEPLSIKQKGWQEAYELVKDLHPFLKYVIGNIVPHIEAAEAGGASQVEVLLKLQHGSQAIRRLRIGDNILGIYVWNGKAECIRVAATESCLETVRTLLDTLEVDIDTVGGLYGTALQAAAAHGHENMVRLCLVHGADINTISGHYGTALQAAAANGYENIAWLCLDHGADTNTISGYYRTALQAAAANGSEKIARLCLEHGADVNAKGGKYYTALHAAADYNLKDIAKVLLEHGADVNVRGGTHGSVLYVTKRRYRDEAMIELLLQNGAEELPPLETPAPGETDSEEWETEEGGSGSDCEQTLSLDNVQTVPLSGLK
jgi:ankyrin repeat protein